MTQTSSSPNALSFYGTLLLPIRKKNFSLQILGLVSLNFKTKQNFSLLEAERTEIFLNFFEEVLNRGSNIVPSGTVSYKLLSDLILILGIRMQEKKKNFKMYPPESSQGMDPFFFSKFKFSFLITFSLETMVFEKSVEKGNTFRNMEGIFSYFNFHENYTDYLLETDQDYKVVDLVGMFVSDEHLWDQYIIKIPEKKRIMKLVFHTSRKTKNYQNLIKSSQSLNEVQKIFKSIMEPESFSERACMVISLEKAEIVSFFHRKEKYRSLSRWLKVWVKNCVQFKISFYSPIKRILDLNFFENDNEKEEKPDLNKVKKVSMNGSLLLGKSFLSKYFFLENESREVLNFFDQIDKISTGFSGVNTFSKNKTSELSFLGEFVRQFNPPEKKDEDFYSFLGLFFSFNNFEGLENVRKLIGKINKKRDKKILEHKIILCMVYLGFLNYSERLMAFLVKNIQIKHISTFFLTGDWLLGKNLETLFFGAGLLFSSPKFLSSEQFSHLEICFKTFFTLRKKKKEHNLTNVPQKAKDRLDEFSISNITGLVMFSSSLMHLKNPLKKRKNFSQDLIYFLKSFGDKFFLDVKQKYFRVYTLLSFGALHFGKKRETFLTSVGLKIIKNKKIRLILRFFIQICSMVGTSDLKLVSKILKNLENYGFLKTKRQQRIHLIQNRLKKFRTNFQTEKKLAPINDSEEKKTFFFSRIKANIGILGLAIVSFNDGDVIQMIFRIFSYFFSNNDLEFSRISILTFGLFFLSKPESSCVDFLIKLIGSKDWRMVKNSVFSLGLIGAGTNNSRINNALKYLGNFYISKIDFLQKNKGTSPQKRSFLFGLKIKSIISTLRISQGLTSSSGNFLGSTKILDPQILEFTKTASLICMIQGFFDSGFVGLKSIPVSIFYLLILLESKTICSLTENLKIKSILIKASRNDSSGEKFKLTPFYRKIFHKNEPNGSGFFFVK